MRALAAVLVLALATIGCRKPVVQTSTPPAVGPDALIAGTVINTSGRWSADTPKGSWQLEIIESSVSIAWCVDSQEKNPGGTVVSRGSSSAGMSIPSTSAWFIFVESPSRLWIFNGKDQLDYSFHDFGGECNTGTSIHTGELHSSGPPVPNDLVFRLPPNLKKLFPDVEAAGKRPSL